MSTEHSSLPLLRMRLRLGVLVLGLSGLVGVAAPLGLAAQEPSPPFPDLAQVLSTATPGEAFLLRYHNRPITTLRATILTRSPQERAAGAVRILDRIVDDGPPGTISTRLIQGVTVLSIGGRDVFALFPLDVDAVGGETLEGKVAEAVARLQTAIDEVNEMRTPRRLLTAILLTVLATVVFAVLIWLMKRSYVALGERLTRGAERKLVQLSANETLVQVARAPDALRRGVNTVFIGLALFLTYNWLTFTLRRFPYTRPWGESLRGFLIDRVSFVAVKIVEAIPDLFMVLLIVLLTRFAVKLSHAVFQSIEDGRLSLPYVYPETAAPTRRLVSTMFWLLAVVVAYPYLPGSNSDAFKGVSVFVGLVLSLGSSGIVNQMMSGVTITYSRAVRIGDFVKIGNIEGTVTHVGALSTKVKTPRGEEVTIPNTVVISDVTINYSRFADTEGVFVPTSLTIGYDTPWRQVQALLLLAAERTPGVRPTPKPVVRQTALQDFYVQYTLMVCLDDPHRRILTLDALHANIQDAFNEYGVQIMSPNYEADPSGPKVVPRDQWFAAPAGGTESAAAGAARSARDLGSGE